MECPRGPGPGLGTGQELADTALSGMPSTCPWSARHSVQPCRTVSLVRGSEPRQQHHRRGEKLSRAAVRWPQRRVRDKPGILGSASSRRRAASVATPHLPLEGGGSLSLPAACGSGSWEPECLLCPPPTSPVGRRGPAPGSLGDRLHWVPDTMLSLGTWGKAFPSLR